MSIEIRHVRMQIHAIQRFWPQALNRDSVAPSLLCTPARSSTIRLAVKYT